MTWFVSAVLIGIITFTIMNIDDILVLAIFFAQSKSNPALKKQHVIMGQYLGFSVLVLASSLVFLTSLVIPLAWIGLLGLVPLGQGIFRLIKLAHKQKSEEQQQPEEGSSSEKASGIPHFCVLSSTHVSTVLPPLPSVMGQTISVFTLPFLPMEERGSLLSYSSSFWVFLHIPLKRCTRFGRYAKPPILESSKVRETQYLLAGFGKK